MKNSRAFNEFLESLPDVQPKRRHWVMSEDDLKSRRRQLIRWPGRMNLKLEPSAEARARFVQLERLHAENQSPEIGFETFKGKRLLWFVEGVIYVEGAVWAECYSLKLTEWPAVDDDSDQAKAQRVERAKDEQAITAHVQRLLGDVRVNFEADLPF